MIERVIASRAIILSGHAGRMVDDEEDPDHYECDDCGKTFEYEGPFELHESRCGGEAVTMDSRTSRFEEKGYIVRASIPDGIDGFEVTSVNAGVNTGSIAVTVQVKSYEDSGDPNVPVNIEIANERTGEVYVNDTPTATVPSHGSGKAVACLAEESFSYSHTDEGLVRGDGYVVEREAGSTDDEEGPESGESGSEGGESRAEYGECPHVGCEEKFSDEAAMNVHRAFSHSSPFEAGIRLVAGLSLASLGVVCAASGYIIVAVMLFGVSVMFSTSSIDAYRDSRVVSTEEREPFPWEDPLPVEDARDAHAGFFALDDPEPATRWDAPLDPLDRELEALLDDAEADSDESGEDDTECDVESVE